MRVIPNNSLSVLLRSVPIIIDAVDKEKARTNCRLYNAIRLVKKEIDKLKKYDNEQSVADK